MNRIHSYRSRSMYCISAVVLVFMVISKATSSAASRGSELDLDELKKLEGLFSRLSKVSHNGNGTTGQEVTQARDGPKKCKCVPYYLCDVGSGNVKRSGENVIQFRDISPKKPCHYLEICCEKLKEKKLLKDNLQVSLHEDHHKKHECGVKDRLSVSQQTPASMKFRVLGTGGSIAQFGEFPWVAAILSNQQPPDALTASTPSAHFLCAGSLIHPKAILTAAHCIHKSSNEELKVRVGEWDTQTTNEPIKHQERRVVQRIIHEGFDLTGANDIALLELETEVELAPNVDTICLPSVEIKADGLRCYAAGWGKDVFGKKGEYAVIMKKVELPLVSKDKCETALRTTEMGFDFLLDDSSLCAGGEANQDTCEGDGGAPLVCRLPDSPSGHYTQLGIVSRGIGCGQEGIPAVYTNVGQLSGWIEAKMRGIGLNSSFYSEN